MAKVGFDFDNTLSRKMVQHYAKELIAQGHDVWIITSRASNNEAFTKDPWQKDRIIKANRKLFRVADNVGIPRSNIKFMNFKIKAEFINGQGFAFHLDDDIDELVEIVKSGDPCKPVNVNHPEWKETCNQILSLYKINL